MTQPSDHVDVLIVGAGLSGIGAACHLAGATARARRTPSSRRARRSRRHLGPVPLPGRPLRLRHVHARLPVPAVDGRQGARRRPVDPRLRPRDRAEYGVDEHVRYGHARRRADWSSADRRWTVTVEHDGDEVTLTCDVPLGVQRLLRLRRGLHPGVRGRRATSTGRVVHPQHWPDDLDYAGKRVVVIGSGATAVTLVPAMAARRRARDDAAALADLRAVRCPSRDGLAARLRARLLRRRAAYARHAVEERPGDHRRSTSSAGAARDWCGGWSARATAAQLPDGYDVDTHFTPGLRPVGPAAVPGARRRPVPGDPPRRRVDRGHRPRSTRSPEPASGSRRARSSRPTSSSPRPG